MIDFGNDEMMPHFIYCYIYSFCFKQLKKLILSRMKIYGIQSSILTGLQMYRRELVTKEKSKEAYEGKLKNEYLWENYEGSINDDLESFFNNLQEISSLEEIKGKKESLEEIKGKKEEVRSFFLPKLTKEELKQVEEKNLEHMLSYTWGFGADVDPEEMKESDSKDKYLHGYCYRLTMVLNLDETYSETSSESSYSITSESPYETSAHSYSSDQIVDQSTRESDSNSIVNSTVTQDGEISRNFSQPNQIDNALCNDSNQALKRLV